MNKTIILSLLLLVGSANMAFAGKKDKNKNKKVAATEQVKLATASDSLSYMAGKTATKGLLPYLINRMNVDTVFMADFVKGYEDAISNANDPQFVAYSAGATIAGQVMEGIFPRMKSEMEGANDSIATTFFHKGFVAALNKDNSICTDSAAEKTFQERIQAYQTQKTEAYKKKNADWLVENGKKAGVNTTASGLQYKVLVAGQGETPKATDRVEVVYEGKMIDGTVFDATSRHHGQKSDKFRCNEVIKGWTEALTSMPVGSKWEIYIPQELGYGQRQAGQIKPYSTLIFTVELKSIEKPVETKPATEADSNKNAGTAKKAKAAIAKRIIMKKK